MLLALLAAVVVIMVYLMHADPERSAPAGNQRREVETSTTAPQESPEEPTPTPPVNPGAPEPGTQPFAHRRLRRAGGDAARRDALGIPVQLRAKSYTYVLVGKRPNPGGLALRPHAPDPAGCALRQLCLRHGPDGTRRARCITISWTPWANLKYGSAETQEYAHPAAGQVRGRRTYTGAYGKCEVVAVNYSVTVGDTHISNAVVVKSDKGYLFFVPDLGLGHDPGRPGSGEVTQRVLSQESVEQSLFERYITP